MFCVDVGAVGGRSGAVVEASRGLEGGKVGVSVDWQCRTQYWSNKAYNISKFSYCYVLSNRKRTVAIGGLGVEVEEPVWGVGDAVGGLDG